ncbi:MAG: methyltransferase domain-containing protein [Syntrophobacteraceae bacterium]|jgi:2-polyprenyl-3-methyl-5-hydroxy-6-metoxy-1,4-benzoquinol methylase
MSNYTFVRDISRKVIRNIKSRYTYVPVQITKSEWDSKYEHGNWTRIAEIDELAHYSVIGGYIIFLKTDCKILDLACGEGLLKTRLCNSYSRYIGIDTSPAAIRIAKQHEDNKSEFMIGAMETFSIDERFHIIVFNECLYYLNKPIKVINAYKKNLEPGGAFIISMHSTENNGKLWKLIDDGFDILDYVSVTNAKGISWIIKVIKP